MAKQTNMPTAAKASAGVWFAMVGFAAAEAFKPLMPPESVFGWFSFFCAGFGFVIGWWVLGPLAGRGYRASLGTGLRTSFTLLFWALTFFSLREMILRSIAKRYKGPTEAVVGTLDIMLDSLRLMGDGVFIGTLLVGGLLGGLFVEWVARRWN
jgi:hypothetical protein